MEDHDYDCSNAFAKQQRSHNSLQNFGRSEIREFGHEFGRDRSSPKSFRNFQTSTFVNVLSIIPKIPHCIVE
jgi:hypothetical protein